ncbi:hypothetical protein K523DRAFT_406879, partial [Schizophyllum commune Tattone D]
RRRLPSSITPQGPAIQWQCSQVRHWTSRRRSKDRRCPMKLLPRGEEMKPAGQ